MFIGNNYKYLFLKRVEQFNDDAWWQMLNKCEMQQYTLGEVLTCSYLVWGLEERIWFYQSACVGGSNTQIQPLMLKAWAEKIKGPVPSAERLHKLPKLIMRICQRKELSPERWPEPGSHSKTEHLQAKKREGLWPVLCTQHCCQQGLDKLQTWLGSHLTWGFHTPHSIDINVFDKGLELHILTHHLVALIVDVNYILCKTANRNRQTKQNEKDSAIPEDDLLTLQMLHGEERRAREGLKILLSPSYKRWEWTEATLIHLVLQHHFFPQQKYPGHTTTPEKPCALYSLIWGFAPAQTSVITSTSFPHSIQAPSCIFPWLHTGQWGSQTVIPVPFPVCGTLQSCSWMPVVDPSHWTSFLWNTSWPRKPLLGRRGLELFPMPTAADISFLFSSSKCLFL